MDYAFRHSLEQEIMHELQKPSASNSPLHHNMFLFPLISEHGWTNHYFGFIEAENYISLMIND